MEFSARGLVLAERTVGEWDKSLTLLCEGIGKIQRLGEGGKAGQKPPAGCLLHVCAGQLQLCEKGESASA